MYKVVEGNGKYLTSTERTIVNKINENPELFLNISISDFAMKLNSTISTISRLSKKITQGTYKDFQIMINKNYYLFKENSDIFKIDNSEKVTKKVRNYLFLSINETMRMLNSEVFNNLQLKIKKADHIFVIGNGKAELAAKDLYYSLLRLGYNTAYLNSFFNQNDVIVNSKNSIIIFFSEDDTFEIRQSIIRECKKTPNELFLISSNEDTLFLAKNHIRTFSFNNYEDEKPILDSIIPMLYINDIIIYMLNPKFYN